MCFVPNNVFAANLTGDILYQQQQGYYFGRPDSGNGMNSGYIEEDNQTMAFPNSNYYLIRPIDTNVNFIYGLKMMTVYSGYTMNSGKYYTIRLDISKGGYMKINDIPSIYNIQTDYNCRTNRGSCAWSWDGNTMVITMNVTNSNSGSWWIQLGSTSNQNKALSINTYTLGEQGWRVSSATISDNGGGSASTDITPIVNQQIATNNKLDQTNSKLNDINGNINDTNDKLDSIGDTLANDSVPSDSDIENTFSDYDVISNGPISALLQIPFNLLSRLYNSFGSSSCRTYILGTLYGTELTIPCINLEFYLGNDLYNIIDTIICVFIYYNLFLLIIHFYESITSFHDYFDDLYVPKHADTGYKPKHGGDS